MNVGRLGRAELVAAVGGFLLAIGVFLPWYTTDPDNQNAAIDGASGSLSAWEVHPVLRWLLLAAASAPFILIWIVIREHELSWPRGELTAVVAHRRLRADRLHRDPRPAGLAERRDRPVLRVLWSRSWVAILMIVGGAMTAGETERVRKPPGVM